ncbi:MAG: Bug family tripartite tricarboxylate transporter substrate binding protein [Lautropia sp.]
MKMLLVLAWSLLAVCLPVHAQEAWPSKPLQIIVPFGPGALTDVAARAIARQLSEQLGQSVVVENRGGAGGTIGTAVVAKAPADGYTLVFTDSSFMIAAALYSKLPFDPNKDFTPVMLAVEAPAVMIVRPKLGVDTVAEFVALAKSKPGALNFGSGGQGSSGHLSVEYFQSLAGIQMVHVPFKGVGAAIVELMADRIDLTIPSLGASIGQIRAGTAKALAVTGKQRAEALPNVPTFAEAGYPAFDAAFRFGFLAPAGTPRPVIERLQKEIASAVRHPSVRQFLASQGAQGIDVRTEDYAKAIAREIPLWRGVITKAGVKVE